jgi:excisionase family DNA binding protein
MSAVSNARAPRAPRRLVSLAEAAARVGCNSKTIRRRISDGSLTGFRLGPRMIRVDADELDSLMRRIPTAGTR